ncbi:MAG: toll/interleukin-1 receptor domain-containing protein [Saprospiraceae bacterium]
MRKDIYLSYELTDQKWADLIKLHLRQRQDELGFHIWDNSQIEAGADIEAAKSNILQSTKIVFVLLSAPYLGSKLVEKEWKQLLELSKHEGVIVRSIFVNHCMFDEHPLSIFQTLNAENNPLVEMDDAEFAGFLVHVGKRIKITLKNVFEKEIQKIETAVVQKPKDISLKNEMKKNIKQLENAIAQDEIQFKNVLDLSLAKICVVSILKGITEDQVNGLRMKEIYDRSKIKKRKFIFQSLDEMEKWGYIEKARIEKETYWKLSKKGIDFSKEIDDSFLFT